MSQAKVKDQAGLVAAVALTRFLFRSHYLYDIDSVNFALALRRFDPAAHQPQPPGYFLYVYTGRLFEMVFRDANAALVAMSVVFSCAAVVMIYALAEAWFGRSAALFAGLIFLFSPLAWFHGTVALTYIVEAFFSALAGYLCWRLRESGEARFCMAAGAALGISAGFRPSSLLFLTPLLLYSLQGAGLKRVASCLGTLALVVTGWLVPMLGMVGSGSYVAALAALWSGVASHGTAFNSSGWNSFARACLIGGVYLLSVGCAAVLPWRSDGAGEPYDGNKIRFTSVWVTPGLCFFTFVFLRAVNSGYLLVLFPPVCIAAGRRAAAWYSGGAWPRFWKRAAVGCGAMVNSLIFIFAPFYCSYGEVLRFEAELRSVIRELPRVAAPGGTLIVGFDSHFLGYRHAGYYLPDYVTVQYPAVRSGPGPRIFAMTRGDTVLTESLPAGEAKQFILFPLPGGDREYREYLASVRKRFSPGVLHATVRDGKEFITGPVAGLKVLFDRNYFKGEGYDSRVPGKR